MSEIDTAAVELETVTHESAAPETPEPPLSVKEHAAKFGPHAKAEPVADEDAEDDAKPAHPSTAQKRDKDTGQFQPGKQRHRAQSQQARAEDVPRIRELTAKQRAAEEKAAALEADLATHRAELAKYRQPPPTTAAPSAPVATPTVQAQTTSAPMQTDPEPQDTDPKYEGNYAAYLEDRARWAAREEYRRERAAERQYEQQRKQAEVFTQRMQKAAEKHPDFQQVALSQPVPWAPGSVVDQFILEDDAGAEILYHLQGHPDERDNLGRMSVLQATKYLSLLSQRLLSPTPEAAGSSGAAPRTQVVVLPPKPPTPLRTEAQRATPTPPPTDGSLSIADHARHFGPKARR